jgi:hypothetical protein
LEEEEEVSVEMADNKGERESCISLEKKKKVE